MYNKNNIDDFKLNIDLFENDQHYELLNCINGELDEAQKHKHSIRFKLKNGYILSCIAGEGTYSSLKSDCNFNCGEHIQDYDTFEIAILDKSNNFDRLMLKFFDDQIYDDVLASVRINDINLFLNKYGIAKQ